MIKWDSTEILVSASNQSSDESAHPLTLARAFPARIHKAGLQIRVCNRKLFFLFLNQNICCGCSKEPSRRDNSFEHPKHMYKLMDKKIITLLPLKYLLNWTYDKVWMCWSKSFFPLSSKIGSKSMLDPILPSVL